ncbi:transcript variant X4, partial [Nothobranchius furzeri]
QDSLSVNKELPKSNNSLTDSNKSKRGMFEGMLRKSNNPTKDGQPHAAVSLQNPELSASKESLPDKSSKDHSGMLGGILKKSPQLGHGHRPSQNLSESSSSDENAADSNPDIKESGSWLSAMFTNPFGVLFHLQEDFSAVSKLSGSSENLSEKTKDGLSVDERSAISNDHTEMPIKSGVAAKILKNPSTTSAQKDPEYTKTLEENKKHLETKTNPVKSNMIQPERRNRSGALLIPTRQPEEETKTSAHDRAQQKTAEEKNDKNPDEMKGTPSEDHAVPVKPPEEATSNDEGLKDDEKSSSREEKKEEWREKAEENKIKKPKTLNPFMPRVKAKIIQRQAQDGAAGKPSEPPSRSVFDQLEDFRMAPSQPEDSQDVEDLMDWWNTVESWGDMLQVHDMTEKEEAKVFAGTAEKVQKGIRVFNELFSERAESLWQHVIDLNAIADSLDKFNKNTKIAQITGGSTSAIGGVATITGLALAPVTMGTSLIVTAVGLGMATAGGLTSAGAGISNQVNNSMDRKKVEKIVTDYQEKIADLNKCLTFVKQGIENLRRFDLIKMKKNTYNQDFPALTSQFYEDGAMAGKAILINANEIMRVVQIANVAGSTAARAVQIASMATGVLTGLFVGMDIYFVAKDSKELKKGAKSEFAAKIREVAMQLHEGLVELNSIREELQSTRSENKQKTTDPDTEQKDKSDKRDSSDEDEILRIKEAIKSRD